MQPAQERTSVSPGAVPERPTIRRGSVECDFNRVAAMTKRASMPAAGTSASTEPPRNRAIETLAALDVTNGGTDPSPIPWLDKNGSHNQMPAPGMEPSSIFHFRGTVARSNDFTGMGTDERGRRIAFGAKSTDFSFMSGEYFAGRQSRRGAFGHI
jgi:hypothetical protein